MLTFMSLGCAIQVVIQRRVLEVKVTHLGLWRDHQYALELAVLPLSDRIPLVRECGTGPSPYSELPHAAVRTGTQR